MSRNFIFTLEAEADALAIWEYIVEDDSEEAADRVIARIYDECQKLGKCLASVIGARISSTIGRDFGRCGLTLLCTGGRSLRFK